MTAEMLRFVTLPQHHPDKRAPALRRRDWGEVYDDFRPEAAGEQAARCAQCGVPFCQIHCPVSNNIPDWLMLTAEGRLREAYEVSSATNNMPEICGRICPQDRLCEGNCVIEKGFESVTIGAVERYITDTAFRNGWVAPPAPPAERPQSVGIVGAGPGGLTAAEELRRYGYQVHVYDRYDRAGGLLIYGIPNFKLEKDIVRRRADLLAAGGVRMHLNVEVGRDCSLADLRARHDALVLATGAYKARDIKVPGIGLGNVFQAMTYLTASNRKGLGDRVPAFDDGTLDAREKDVVVVGGGDSALEEGLFLTKFASRVRIIHRRDELRASQILQKRARAHDKIEFVLNAVVTRIHAGADASVAGIDVQDTQNGATGSLDTDGVFIFVGHIPNNELYRRDFHLDDEGYLVTDKHMRTNVPGVFAAGEIQDKVFKQVATSVGQGCAAAMQAEKFLAELEETGWPGPGADPRAFPADVQAFLSA